MIYTIRNDAIGEILTKKNLKITILPIMAIIVIIISPYNVTIDGYVIEYSKTCPTAQMVGQFLYEEESLDRYPRLQKAFNNSAPLKPSQPNGQSVGEAGTEYTYTSNTTDPDGDEIYYLFDWGDGTDSGWIGPFDSGDNASASHIWSEKGLYEVKVKAKDINELESEWSDPLDVEISGPYLTFKDIESGLGLTVEIENIGNIDATNIELNLEVVGGFIIKLSKKYYEIPLIPAGESTETLLKIWGVGLGIITEIPNVIITVSAPNTKTRGKRIVARILGPLVIKVGESWDTDESFEGYTLYNPMISMNTFLINNSGEVVHTWNNHYKPALSVYLLENGDILRTAFPGFNPRFWGGGIGGRVEMIDWNGTPVWEFEYTNSEHCLHHDVEMLPNGNVLMIAWEYKSASEAINAGRNPNSLPMGELWLDHIIEVEPTGNSGGNIVWEWHVWDHLIQDYNPTKENYGVVEDHPELIDINYGGQILADWNHINAIDFNEEFDQIILSVLLFNEIWVIDHSTTIEEAAGHTGGNSGKGGDLLYRWGNPQTYRAGSASDQKLFRQHDAQWIESGYPGEGNILVFNNGRGRPGGAYSSVDEIVPPVDSNGNYSLHPGSAYGPEVLRWTYIAEKPTDFYAINLAGAQRLPNGNTLVCNGPHGIFFEVTPEKEIIWEYLNQVPNLIDNHVFTIHRYAPDYPGLENLFD